MGNILEDTIKRANHNCAYCDKRMKMYVRGSPHIKIMCRGGVIYISKFIMVDDFITSWEIVVKRDIFGSISPVYSSINSSNQCTFYLKVSVVILLEITCVVLLK